MSIFNTILQKLGIEKPAPAPAPVAPIPAPSMPAPKASAPAPVVSTAANVGGRPAAKSDDAMPTPPAPHVASIPVVDVVKKLDNLAGTNSGLDWKVSIVDLLKLLGMDSSLEARKELAKELNCPADLMTDSAKMNTWLHQTVLQKIAENGGNIPQSLLH